MRRTTPPQRQATNHDRYIAGPPIASPMPTYWRRHHAMQQQQQQQ